MARLNESPANGAQSANKRQITLKNGALGGFLSSPAKPSGSQSPHPSKRLKSLTATANPRSQASRSVSPAGQRLASQPPLSSPARKTFNDTADNMDIEDRSTPADSVQAAPADTPADTPAESTPTPSAPSATIELGEASAVTPEPVVPRPGVVSSVRKTLTNVVNNFTAARNGNATVTSTFEQTVVSRKRSREPETGVTLAPAEETPTPADKQAEEATDPADVTAGANDTNVELGNQFEADVEAERAKSPEKQTVQEPSPATDAGEINVTTTAANADTIEAAQSVKPAATAEDEDEDMADDPEHGRFVLDAIIGHRQDPMDKTLFQMHVRWKHDLPSWEPESNIQEDAEEALFEYWDSVKGGRLGAMVDKNLWHVLRVEKHKQKANGKVELLVAWTGSPDRSWEPEENMKQVAKELVREYWASKGGREKYIKAIAVPAKRGRGRPRKVVEDVQDAPRRVKAKEPKAAAEPAPKKARGGRKKLTDGAESQDEMAKETAAKKDQPEQVAAKEAEANEEEPAKKRGRGRPRMNPVA